MGVESLNPYIAGAQALTGSISAISGIFQKARANKLAKKNIRPGYDVPDAINNNQQIAEQQATQGLPGQQYTQATQGITRNANNTIAASQDRRGGLATVGVIQQGTNDATLNLDVADTNTRLANIRNLMQQNNVMAQFKDKQWEWNRKDKYEENAAAIRALKTAGNANINSGLNSIASAGAEYLNGGGADDNPAGKGTPTDNQQKLNKFNQMGNYKYKRVGIN